MKKLLLCLSFFLFFSACDLGKYEVVAGSGNYAWRVDTETGEVWMITPTKYPTMKKVEEIPYSKN